MRIFVVEDEEEIRMVVGLFLKAIPDTEVRILSGGEEAVAFIEANGVPDLLITDYDLEKGWKASRVVVQLCEKQVYPQNILLMSGRADEDVMDMVKNLKIEFLQKPFEYAVFLAKVREMLARGTTTASDESAS